MCWNFFLILSKGLSITQKTAPSRLPLCALSLLVLAMGLLETWWLPPRPWRSRASWFIEHLRVHPQAWIRHSPCLLRCCLVPGWLYGVQGTGNWLVFPTLRVWRLTLEIEVVDYDIYMIAATAGSVSSPKGDGSSLALHPYAITATLERYLFSFNCVSFLKESSRHLFRNPY